ncbi:MAG: hypothetical protein SPL12_10410 [Bacteroidales bacterium]|nr:hypothetical protein [Bacteroidales bacterium]
MRQPCCGCSLALCRLRRARLRPIGTSNAQLQILYSRDHSLALLQAGRLETGHFEPDTPVVQLSGSEFAALKELCK